MLECLHRPERLDFLALSFTCRADSRLSLDNAYSDLHGGFGLLLHRNYPHVYRELYGDQTDSAMVRSYVLRPGRELLRPIDGGCCFSFELILYGASVRHAVACIESISMLAQTGVTKWKQRFSLESVSRVSPQAAQPIWSAGNGWQLTHLQPVSASSLLEQAFDTERWRLHLDSPTAIKAANALLRSGLTPGVLFERLLGRAQLLATQQPGGPLLDPASKGQLLAHGNGLRGGAENLTWNQFSRYSVRQGQRNEFGGLTGWLEILGNPGPLGGWLHLLPWLHVGSKTSFGYGQCMAAPAGAGGKW